MGSVSKVGWCGKGVAGEYDLVGDSIYLYFSDTHQRHSKAQQLHVLARVYTGPLYPASHTHLQ